MTKIPDNAERLMNELPQDVLNEIQLDMILWSGHKFIEQGFTPKNKKQFKSYMKRFSDKQMSLLCEAKAKLDSDRGAS